MKEEVLRTNLKTTVHLNIESRMWSRILSVESTFFNHTAVQKRTSWLGYIDYNTHTYTHQYIDEVLSPEK